MNENVNKNEPTAEKKPEKGRDEERDDRALPTDERPDRAERRLCYRFKGADARSPPPCFTHCSEPLISHSMT